MSIFIYSARIVRNVLKGSNNKLCKSKKITYCLRRNIITWSHIKKNLFAKRIRIRPPKIHNNLYKYLGIISIISISSITAFSTATLDDEEQDDKEQDDEKEKIKQKFFAPEKPGQPIVKLLVIDGGGLRMLYILL